MHREHPLRALRRSTRSIWLLIFPLLRGAYHIASAEEVMVWLRGAWFDLLILLAILGYGVLDWFFREFTVENGQIYVQEGILVTRRRYLPLRNLTALTIEHPFWMRPIGASYVYADTAAGLLSSTDIRLMIRMRDESLFLSAAPHVRQGRRHHAEHKGGFWRILLFSVIFSNSFTGLLYIVVFLFQFRRIVQDLITEFQLNDRFNEVSENVSRKLSGIPPIVVTVIIVLAAAWLLSLIINILRYGKFDMHSDRHTVSIHSGLLTRRNHILVAEKVNYADLRQNLWTKLFRVYSLAVSIPGYGNQRGSIPIWLPIQTRREIDEALPMLFPDYRRTRRDLHPPLWALWGYTWRPLLCGAAVLMLDKLDRFFPAVELAQTIFPPLEGAISFFRIMLFLPIAWKILVEAAAVLTNGVTIADGSVCMRCCRGTTFHTIIADTDSVVKIKIYRHIWQFWTGGCHLAVWFRSEVPRRYTIRCLNYKETMEKLAPILSRAGGEPDDPS